jgi:predicted MPP superfamily phosphohydrolase
VDRADDCQQRVMSTVDGGGSHLTATADAVAVHRDVTDTSATVHVRGLHAPLTVLHLSDSHVDAGPEPGNEEESAFMHQVYSQGSQHRRTGEVVSATDALAASVEVARAGRAQLILHTGDLVNFPSRRAVDRARQLLEAAQVPVLYTCGNHDWEYGHPQEWSTDDSGQVVASRGEWVFSENQPGAAGGADAIRAHSRADQLSPLFGGREPDAWCVDVETAGLRIVGIDNSNYQVSPAQHQVLLEALNGCSLSPSRSSSASAAAAGVVLMVHIPLYTAELLASMQSGGRDVHSAVCGNPSAVGAHKAPNASTLAFLATVARSPQLVCVLCGHIHSAQAHRLHGEWRRTRPGERTPWPLHGCMQLVVDAGCYGGYREIHFVPAEQARM